MQTVVAHRMAPRIRDSRPRRSYDQEAQASISVNISEQVSCRLAAIMRLPSRGRITNLFCLHHASRGTFWLLRNLREEDEGDLSLSTSGTGRSVCPESLPGSAAGCGP